MIFVEEDPSQPFSSPWILVKSKTDDSDVREAKRLTLNQQEKAFLASSYNELEMKALELAFDGCWIVRESDIDTDMQVMTTDQMKKDWTPVISAGSNVTIAAGDQEVKDQMFWFGAVGFSSNDTDMAPDGVRSADMPIF